MRIFADCFPTPAEFADDSGNSEKSGDRATYIVGWKQLDEVVGKHSDATLQLALPPASVGNILIENSDDVTLGQTQLVAVRSFVREADNCTWKFG